MKDLKDKGNWACKGEGGEETKLALWTWGPPTTTARGQGKAGKWAWAGSISKNVKGSS